MAPLQALNVKGIKNILIRQLTRDRKLRYVPCRALSMSPSPVRWGQVATGRLEEDSHFQYNGREFGEKSGWFSA